MASDKPMDRRRFFRAGLAELLNFKPLGKAVAPLEELAKQLGKLDEPRRPAPPPVEVRRAQGTVSYAAPGTYGADLSDAHGGDDEPTDHYLRPPGARIEEEFRNVCSRCGNCVHACPVQAIKLDHSGARGHGVPYIDPNASACVMCEGINCVTHCPSGALLPITLSEIDMGTAEWHESTCVRTAQGEECTMCTDHCPVGATAIEVVENRIVVHPSGCTGCGSCQNNCPTMPKSITITPRSKRDAVPAD